MVILVVVYVWAGCTVYLLYRVSVPQLAPCVFPRWKAAEARAVVRCVCLSLMDARATYRKRAWGSPHFKAGHKTSISWPLFLCMSRRLLSGESFELSWQNNSCRASRRIFPDWLIVHWDALVEFLSKHSNNCIQLSKLLQRCTSIRPFQLRHSHLSGEVDVLIQIIFVFVGSVDDWSHKALRKVRISF